jgi:hypothetical protein
MDGYTLGWIGWIAYFVVLEGAALLKKRGSTAATLSGHVWLWFGIPGPGNPGQSAHPDAWARFRRAVLSAGMSWLTTHFMSGGAASGTLTAFFGWPNGGIWGNLLASVVWTLPALWWHHRKLAARHDAQLEATSQVTDLVSSLHTKVDAAARRDGGNQ